MALGRDMVQCLAAGALDFHCCKFTFSKKAAALAAAYIFHFIAYLDMLYPPCQGGGNGLNAAGSRSCAGVRAVWGGETPRPRLKGLLERMFSTG